MAHWSEAADRNRHPILDVLREVLPATHDWRVLEIGSGTGQHAVYFTEQLPHLDWQTSDLQANHKAIRSTLEKHASTRVKHPLELEAATIGCLPSEYDAVYTANTCHIMSWDNVRKMFAQTGTLLQPEGRFVLYGPFHVGNQATSESNHRFDHYLSQVNPRQGIRNREDIAVLADTAGLSLIKRFDMPANNQMLVFEKRARAF